MKVFWSYYHENILKTSVLLWVSKSCYVIYGFIWNNNSVEMNINIQQILCFFLGKTINISYLIMVIIKMRLLTFLVFSRYWLAYIYRIVKYRIICQISIYYWMENCIFWYFQYCIFISLKIKLQLIGCINWLWQVRWLVTWWFESSIINSDSNLTHNIIRETIKVGKKKWMKI